MANKIVFGYWNVRGLGQPIRYLLRFAKADFVERTYRIGPPPENDRSEWLEEKFELGFDFPNLPYIIHGPIQLTQSKAILRYLGRVLALDGQSELERTRIDQAEQQTVDLRNALRQICFFEPDTLDAVLRAHEPVLGQFDRFIGAGWVLADRVSYADFFLFETLDMLLDLKPGGLDAYPQLKSYHRRFAQLPTIQAYRESPEFRQLAYFYGAAKLFAKPHLV